MRSAFTICDSSQTGITLIETIVALALLGIIIMVFLAGVVNSSVMSNTIDDRESAKNLAESALEWAKNADYSYNATGYDTGPIPDTELFPGFSVNLSAQALHVPDDGIQKLSVTVSYNGTGIYSLEGYKTDR